MIRLQRRWSGPYFAAFSLRIPDRCVDLKSDEGRRLLLDLVTISDVVVENFRVGALDRLGLGFSALAQANPRIVLASISSQGTTGPGFDAISFGSTLEASSGMASLVGYPNAATQVSGLALNYPDQVASLFAAGLVVAGIIDVRATGRAAHLDISQREIASFLLGEHIVAAAHGANGAQSSTGAPAMCQGIYRAGDGRWVAVTIEDNVARLPVRSGAGSTGCDEATLAAWIGARSADEVVTQFREAGAFAEIVRDVAHMLDAGGPAAAGIAIVTDPQGFPVKGLPWTTNDQPLQAYCAAPALGADNRAIVVDLLQRDATTYAALVVAGVLADRPRRD
jgi:crotonobetainyl-CoA:carnitine CoA-transferase CaiB-like acyl-CoA transferase